jgi:tRNA 2-thiouridine synthesizing protein E
MAVMMEVMRHVGRAARAVKEKRDADPKRAQREKLAAAIGPRRNKPVGAAPAPDRAPPLSACAVPAKPQSVAAVIDGVAFTADGHLADPKAWNETLAAKIAASLAIELDDARWALVRTARADFEKVGASPNIRRLTQLSSLGTKEVYALFPKAPARTVAKIAGIPKPAGCI